MRLIVIFDRVDDEAVVIIEGDFLAAFAPEGGEAV